MVNAEIVAIVNTYLKSKQEGHDIRLPAATSWKRRVNLDKLYKAKLLIDEALEELQAKYNDNEHSEEKETEEGKMRFVKPAYRQAFLNAQKEILMQDTPVSVSKIKIGDLGDITLTDEEMDTLAFMIEETEEETDG